MENTARSQIQTGELEIGMIQKLECITGCKIDRIDVSDLKGLEDVIATLTDPDAYNEYPCDAPSAQKFLVAVALMASLCYYADVPKGICERFYQALGEFIVTRDARAFLVLDPDYSD